MLLCRRSRAARTSGVGAVDVAEEPVEHHARVGLHRQRRRRAAPREPVLVGAAETDVAGADAVDGVRPLQAELQRGQRRLLAHRVRENLIHRDAQLQAGAAGGRQRLDAGQEGAGRAWHGRRRPPNATAPPVLSSPLTSSRWSRYGSSGFRVGVNSKPRPSASGVHRSMMMPFGT